MNKISIFLFGFLLAVFSLCYSTHTFSLEKSLEAQKLLNTTISTPKALDILWEAAITEKEKKYVAKIVATYINAASDLRLDIDDIIVVAASFGNAKSIKNNAEELNRISAKYREMGLHEKFTIAASALWSIGSNAQSSLFYPLNEIVVATVFSELSNSENNKITASLIKMISMKNLALYGSNTGQCG